MYVLPRQLEVGNRVLRQYEGQLDRFLRVAFTDEDHDRLAYDADVAHVRRALAAGLDVAGRRFEPLAFSASQLRGQQYHFWAPSPGTSSNDVRSWMGDFSAERCVAKHAARMGQCFSTTLCASAGDEPYERIEDVKTADQRYIFSDGCGTIHASLAAELTAGMGCPPGHVPSAYQIR